MSGFMCRVSGFRFRVQGSGFGGELIGGGPEDSDLGYLRYLGSLLFRVSGFGFRVPSFGWRMSGLGFRVSSVGFWVQGLRMSLLGGFQKTPI